MSKSCLVPVSFSKAAAFSLGVHKEMCVNKGSVTSIHGSSVSALFGARRGSVSSQETQASAAELDGETRPKIPASGNARTLPLRLKGRVVARQEVITPPSVQRSVRPRENVYGALHWSAVSRCLSPRLVPAEGSSRKTRYCRIISRACVCAPNEARPDSSYRQKTSVVARPTVSGKPPPLPPCAASAFALPD